MNLDIFEIFLVQKIIGSCKLVTVYLFIPH